MYVAVKELNLGNGKRAAPGQPVPEALSWEYPVIIAHLNLNMIRWEGEGNPEFDGGKAKVNLKTVPLYEGDRFKSTTKRVAVMNGEDLAPKKVEAKITCECCPGRTFKTEKHLKTHLTFQGKKK